MRCSISRWQHIKDGFLICHKCSSASFKSVYVIRRYRTFLHSSADDTRPIDAVFSGSFVPGCRKNLHQTDSAQTHVSYVFTSQTRSSSDSYLVTRKVFSRSSDGVGDGCAIWYRSQSLSVSQLRVLPVSQLSGWPQLKKDGLSAFRSRLISFAKAANQQQSACNCE